MIWLLPIILIQVEGPDTQIIDLNPEKVVVIRAPRAGDHFGPGVKCVISTTDGRFIGVVQKCEVVKQLLEGAGKWQ